MADGVRFFIDEPVALADRRIQIRLQGLQPYQCVMIRARRRTIDPTIDLASEGEFTADEEGTVDLQLQAPMHGTYTGVDGMGLFWSMQRITTELVGNTVADTPLSPMLITLTAHEGDELLATAVVDRRWLADDVHRVPVREAGIVATFFHHGDDVPRPGIIILGGSEGGLHEYMAALFASHGYSTLALAYFGTEDLPAELVNIPLEYVETALRWFASQSSVSEQWIAVHGTSKGGELALLAASLFPQIKSAVCVASGGIVFHGISRKSSDVLLPAWTLAGKSIPYASAENPYRSGKIPRPVSRHISYRPWYDAHLSDPHIVEAATIPVEQIQGSVLFVSGGKDQMIDSVRISDLAMARLRNAKHPYTFEHLVYPEAGHAINLPYRLSTIHTQAPSMEQTVLVGGGTLLANVKASEDAWTRTLAFFAEESQGTQWERCETSSVGRSE